MKISPPTFTLYNTCRNSLFPLTKIRIAAGTGTYRNKYLKRWKFQWIFINGVEWKSCKVKCQRYMTFTPPHQQIRIEIYIFSDIFPYSIVQYSTVSILYIEYIRVQYWILHNIQPVLQIRIWIIPIQIRLLDFAHSDPDPTWT